jgi:uncharacterized protein with PQ loop repeat
MNIGLHHIVRQYRKQDFISYLKASPWFKVFIDRAIYVIGIFSVCILVPQLVEIISSKSAEGVSLITWVGFFISSSFWLVYGLIHKEHPIVITNAGALLIDFMIIVSILMYR